MPESAARLNPRKRRRAGKPGWKEKSERKARKEELMSQGFTLWFTGLSGAGKTTLTDAIVPILRARGLKIEVLDGDEVRTNLSKGLGFSKEDRDTNIRRIGYVSRLLARNGVGVIAAAISPYREVRAEVRRAVEADGALFIEVYVKASLDALLARDVKGLYRRALAGEIKQFTGISDPYEEPHAPELVIESDSETVEQSAAKILAKLTELGLLAAACESIPAFELEEARCTP
jgi:adenylylsulfate kinase